MKKQRKFLASKITLFFIFIFASSALTFWFNLCYQQCGSVTSILNSFQQILLISESHGQSQLAVRSSTIKQNSANKWIDKWKCTKEGICVYSAYLDDRTRDKPFVRVIAVAPYQKRMAVLGGVKCFLRIKDKIIKGNFSFSTLMDHHYRPNAAMFFFCHPMVPIDSPITEVELQTTTTKKWKKKRNRRFSVRVHPRNENRDGSIALCVRPFFNTQSPRDLASFVAYYNLLGVKHFSFYDYSTRRGIRQLLSRFISEGHRIELLRWKAPHQVFTSWQIGQLAFTHDCIYRNANRYTYVLVLDIDEYIVPKVHTTLPELVDHIQKQEGKKKIGAFSFNNVFFCNGTNDNNETMPLFTRFEHTEVFNFCNRSKFMVTGQAFKESIIHCVTKQQKGWSRKTVPTSLATMHHYRSTCPSKFFTEDNADTSIMKYKQFILESSFMTIWRQLFKP